MSSTAEKENQKIIKKENHDARYSQTYFFQEPTNEYSNTNTQTWAFSFYICQKNHDSMHP